MLLDEFKNMLNKVYELEGLLELGVRRGENIPESLPSLVADKCFAIANQAVKWNTFDVPQSEKIENTYSIHDNLVADEKEDKAVEIFVNNVLSEAEGLQEIQSEDELIEESSEEEYEEMIESHLPEETPKEIEESSTDLEEIADDTELEAVAEAEADPESEIEKDAEDSKVEGIIYEEANEDVVENDAVEMIQHQNHSSRPLVSFFSINDKFRFRRELFSNSNAELVDSLNLIETMDSLSEAEDYFFNDLQWDPDSEDVIDFLRIIKAYFAP